MLLRLLVLFLMLLAVTADAQNNFGSASYDSGTVTITVTPNGSSHAAGTSVGGLLAVPVARTPGGSGIITNFGFISSGGNVGAYLVRIWQKNPASTTCTDNVAFAGSAADNVNLITFAPMQIATAAVVPNTGDSNAYSSSPNLTLDYRNNDTAPSLNLYVCVTTVSTDTADESNPVYVMMSGPQN